MTRLRLVMLLFLSACSSGIIPIPQEGVRLLHAAVGEFSIQVVVYEDTDAWEQAAAQLGRTFTVRAFTNAGVVHVPEVDLYHLLAHELSHAYEYHSTGRVDQRLNRHCLAEATRPDLPLAYWCQHTEILARYREHHHRRICGGSLYPFGLLGMPCVYDLTAYTLEEAVAARAW